ncbi:MAG: hypothetical protein ACYCZN_01490 [Candidatus Dormibacteria bacterium]
MAIAEVTMYVAVCDQCGARDDEGDFVAWTDAETAMEMAVESTGWYQVQKGLLCGKCYLKHIGEVSWGLVRTSHE